LVVKRQCTAEASIDEPTIVEPIFVSGIAQAKVIGGLLYMALFVEKPGEWQGGERVIKARLIMPITALIDGRAKVDAALSEHGMRVLSRASWSLAPQPQTGRRGDSAAVFV
jgi:hypothetical protein